MICSARKECPGVSHLKGNAAFIDESAHQSIQRINLPHKRALADSSDTGIARHLAYVNLFQYSIYTHAWVRADWGCACSSIGVVVQSIRGDR